MASQIVLEPRSTRKKYLVRDDLRLLNAVISIQPFFDAARWEQVAVLVYEETGKHFSPRSVKERLDLLLIQFRTKDRQNRRKSGTEEEYEREDMLLQEISDMAQETEYRPRSVVRRRTQGCSSAVRPDRRAPRAQDSGTAGREAKAARAFLARGVDTSDSSFNDESGAEVPATTLLLEGCAKGNNQELVAGDEPHGGSHDAPSPGMLTPAGSLNGSTHSLPATGTEDDCTSPLVPLEVPEATRECHSRRGSVSETALPPSNSVPAATSRAPLRELPVTTGQQRCAAVGAQSSSYAVALYRAREQQTPTGRAPRGVYQQNQVALEYLDARSRRDHDLNCQRLDLDNRRLQFDMQHHSEVDCQRAEMEQRRLDFEMQKHADYIRLQEMELRERQLERKAFTEERQAFAEERRAMAQERRAYLEQSQAQTEVIQRLAAKLDK